MIYIDIYWYIGKENAGPTDRIHNLSSDYLENFDIDKDILENIDINIDIDKDMLGKKIHFSADLRLVSCFLMKYLYW